jgi:anti-sigma regulatory factor (Ser/Thr protein kinase)
MAAALTLTLPSDSSAPGLARAVAKRYLAGGLSPSRLGELSVVISELVTNASVHGRGTIILRLQLDGQTVRGEVIDEGGGFEHEIRERGPEDVSGRGLFLVDALANRWGIHEGTTHVWFEIEGESSASEPLNPRLGQAARPEALG